MLLPSAYTLLSTLVNLHVLPALRSPARGGPITRLTEAEIASFKPFSWYASTGNCDPSRTRNWTCGINCDANPEFIPVASGGDGDETQFCVYTSSMIRTPLILVSRVRGIRSNVRHRGCLASRYRFQQNVCIFKLPSSPRSELDITTMHIAMQSKPSSILISISSTVHCSQVSANP